MTRGFGIRNNARRAREHPLKPSDHSLSRVADAAQRPRLRRTTPGLLMSNNALPAQSAARWLPYIVAGTFFMEYLDTTVIATALPQMAKSFGVGPNALSLGMTAYMLALAIFIPVSGWVADRFGSRTVFFGAIVVFIVASVLCGMSNSVAEFT